MTGRGEAEWAPRSFGRIFPEAKRVVSAADAAARLRGGKAAPGSLLGFGCGRSYGDTCLNSDGALVDMRAMSAILSFDSSTGIVECEAGAMLCEIIAATAPMGFFPAVVPGTRFVTVGGAIANDVHGKNHHRRGAFGGHVLWLDLLRSDGRMTRCSTESNPHLFAATIGGMGLTGLILRAAFRLMRVPSLDVAEAVTPFGDLDDYFDIAEAADRDNEYAVGWVDQLAGGRKTGRGLLLTGNHAAYGARSAGERRSRLAVPFQPPFNVLNRPALAVFNSAYRRAKLRSKPVSGYEGFFFPLDGVRNWNRLYGPAGLFQHQSVVPLEAARRAIPELLAAARAAGQYSFLTVLKRFGARRSPGMMSFPRPGYTLTLDFPNRGRATRELLDRLDSIAIGAGGAVNPYKDARMPPETFAASFPDWRRFEDLRDPAFQSDFWKRTALRLQQRMPQPAAAE